MNRLKTIFYTIIATVLFFVACDPVQNSYTSDSYLRDIYTVNNNTTLTPEFGDTSLRVSNFNEFGLRPGDRVSLYLHYHFDAYDANKNELKIVELLEKIQTLSIGQCDSVDVSDYDLPLRVSPYDYQPSIWVWNNRLNINAIFAAKADSTDFVMSLRGVERDTVMLNLSARTTAPLGSYEAKLLSYDIADIGKVLADEEVDSLKQHKKLIFRIYLKNKDDKGNLFERPYLVEKGEFANPLYY